MNVNLKTELLSRLWFMAAAHWPEEITPQVLYGVPITARIETIYMETLEKFLDRSLPWYSKQEDETKQITYVFPKENEVIQHLIYKILLQNRSTFVRFFIASYLQQDPDSVVSAQDIWLAMLEWARKYQITPQYLPVSDRSLTEELTLLGYTRVKDEGGRTAFWGLKLLNVR